MSEEYSMEYNKEDELYNKLEQLEDTIANLKEQVQSQVEATIELDKENAELNEKVNILDNCDRLGDVITEAYKEQLTEATDLLKKMYYLYFDPCVTHKDLENREKLFEEVKQFLKEIEK